MVFLRLTCGEDFVFGTGGVFASVRAFQRSAKARPENADDEIKLGRGRNLVLKIAVVPHRFVFPEIGLDENASREFRDEPIDQALGNAPLLVDVTGDEMKIFIG